ncbi:polymorphic toxin-type HINT domain-containing protein [Kitasatospora sp. NBC_01539]|uniref:polymorphic toxin-type HINT domain-containing protein n=1 Tax=Kitasatospora sp. NBC_01539 TaxID=2903577 RepID=UPI00386026BE
MVAAVLVGSLLPTLPMAAAASAAGSPKLAPPSPGKPVRVSDTKVKARKPDTTVSKPEAKHTAWPKAGTAKVTAPPGKPIKAGDLPVTLTTTGGGTSPSADVQVLDQETARKAGISGVLLTVAAPGAPAGTSAKVAVDYSGFAQAVGAGFGARLHLVQLQACVLTTPEKPECRVQTQLEGGNDTEHQAVTADAVPLTAPATPVGQVRVQSASGGVTVLAATAGDAGPTGDYKATPLSAASTWSTSLNSGSFTWSYDMPLTAMPGGLTPKVGLAYDSGSVDGRTSNSNNQGSWAGDGFTLDSGSVERTYKACADDGAPKTDGSDPGDQCWATDNATISFAGHAGELIPVSADEWRIKGDDNTKVVRVRDTGRGNGDNDGEYFKATTPDGTSYFFGYNRLTNWTSGKAETKSVYTVPVFGNNAGEPCYSSSGFGSSWCQQGWRWNLDLVVDAHGNDITYWYTPETNNYGRNLKATDRTPYVRGGRLDHIEYGQRQSDIYSATVKPMAKVEFKTAERCLETTASLCDAANIDTNRQYWYDTPWDQNCKDNTDCTGVLSPSFFTRTRLTQVVASTLQGDGTYKGMDTWDLTHKWGTADFDYQLLLDTILHTGTATTPTVTLPKTTLAYKQLVNRMDRTGDGRLPFIKQRLGTVTDEQGGQTDVNYSAAACDPAALPTPQTNITRCFPQQYQPNNDTPVTTEWFNKYVVESVTGTDRTGHAPDMVTHYTYLGDAAWHFDDLDGITKEKLKTWSQWRGYQHVKVETGGTTAMSTQTDHWFLRGMDGDRTSPTDKTQKRTVTVPDGQGTTITDDQAWAGFEYRTEQYDKPAGKILTKAVNTPWKKTTATRVRDWGTTTANLTGTQITRAFTSLDQGVGAAWRETRANTTFDAYGRATQSEDLGDTAVAADNRCTRTTYADNATAWILVGAIRTETVAADCATTVDRVTKADGTSAVLTDNRIRFDGQAYGSAPTKGDITVTGALKSRTSAAATYLDNTSTFDVYGRVLSTTELANSTAVDNTTGTSTSTALPEARTTTTVYTPASGRPTQSVITSPPAKATDSTTTQVTTNTFDLLRGQTVTATDANTKRTDSTYDALGRVLKVWLPDQSKSSGNTPNYEYAYTLTDQQITAVSTKTVANDQSQETSYTLYDGFGRTRQAQVPGDTGGRLIADTFYDERGQAVLAYAPYYATGAPSKTLSKVEDATGVDTQTRSEFDGLGRVTKSTVLAGSGVGTPLATTVTEYGGDRVTVIPPAGATATTTISDAAGQVTELRQYKASPPGPGTAYDTVSYSYDPAGHLTGLTGPGGAQWAWLYDQLGRQTKAVDPDTGTSTKAYNTRGEVTSTTDGRGKTIATVYDNIGRLLETRDGSATGPLLTSRTWDPSGYKGQLASSSRFTTVGGTTYEYKTAYSLFDTLYRPRRTSYTVPSVPNGQQNLAGTYDALTTYNTDGTTKSVSYPAAGNLAAETLNLTYDLLHRPTKASGLNTYLTGQIYDYVGKPLQSTLSNGTANKVFHVTNAYESGTQRLKTSTTDVNATTVLRQAGYTYDQAGNVTSLTDASASGTDRQCYQYDYLTRLTDAFTPTAGTCPATPTGAALGGPAAYWTSWTYNTDGTRATETRHNPAGNTAQDATSTYTYPQTHRLGDTSTVTGALGSPVSETYAYDLSGNTTDRHLKPAANQSSDQKLTWDAENHLTQVADTVKTTSGSTTTTTNRTTDYLYDADGNRLLAHNLDTAAPTAENWTLYLGGTELKLTKGMAKPAATRYYPLGAATAVRTDDNTLTFQTGDHHGTAELNINATTGAVDQRRTTPFGSTRGTPPTGWAGAHGFLGGTTEPTGLTHLGARDYDPTTGRFISVDPVLAATDPQSLAGYTYSNNNPLAYSDPSGLRLAPVDGGGGTGCEGASCTMQYLPQEELPTDGKYTEVYPGIVIRNSHRLFKKIRTALYKAIEADCDGWIHGFGCLDVTAYNTMSDEGRTVTQSILARDLFLGCVDADSCDSRMLAGAIIAGSNINDMFGDLPSGRYDKLKGKKPGAEPTTNPKTCKNSFPAGTLVLEADGSMVPIEQLAVGDEITATDPETGETGPRKVDATIATPDDRQFTTLTIRTADGATSSLTATDHHPFWSENRHQWLDAADLVAGDSLRTSTGSTVTIAKTNHWAGLQAAFNLTVRDLHTYYVLAGSTPILVHNEDRCFFAGAAKARPDDLPVDADGNIHPPTPEDLANLNVHGKSAYSSVDDLVSARLSAGQQIRSFSELPDGVGSIADGVNVGGTMPAGHVTLYPTRVMTRGEFDQLLTDGGWNNIGQKTP